jgi:hypothetical protein
MNTATRPSNPALAKEEIQRRTAEYRQLGFQRQAPAQIVYDEANIACPWAGCDIRIAGINFQLEKMGDSSAVSRWLAAWWKGPGLIGRCPGCHGNVLFEINGKRAVADPKGMENALLPEDWHQKAHLVMRPL